MSKLAYLPARGVVEISGPDRVAFLQGLVSNDVELVAPGRAVWAAMLTPQGKWLADFFMFAVGDAIWLDCERAQAPMLVQRLGRYRLRAQVALRDISEGLFVHAAWDGVPELPGDAVVAPDPRVAEAGLRIIARTELAGVDWTEWDLHRLKLGLPDGSRDLESEKTVLLEAGFDEFGGISWTKGCYMGQELTARTKYRGLVKRRLVPVEVTGPLPGIGIPIFIRDREVGAMRSGFRDWGLAQIRTEVINIKEIFLCGPALLRPFRQPLNE